MKFFSFKTPFDPSKKLSDNKIKKLFISKRKNFIENKNKNLNFFLKHRYNLINKQLINCSKILEIGSGAGLAKFFINKKFISSDIINNEWIENCFNAENIPYKNNYFDAIFTIDTILHLNNPKKFFLEVARVLKPGGLLIINDINLSLLHRFFIKRLKHLQLKPSIDLYKYDNSMSEYVFDSNPLNLEILLNDNKKFKEIFNLRKVSEKKVEFLTYILSGGVSANFKIINIPLWILNIINYLDKIILFFLPNIFGLSRNINFIKSKTNINNIKISGWGEKLKKNHFEIDINNYEKISQNIKVINLAIGQNKSYGDICTYENKIIVNTKKYNNILDINYNDNEIICQSGVTIDKINETINDFNYILPITGGFEKISVGGAIANNIHGKNNIKYSSFGDQINWIKIITKNGNILKISNDQYNDLFLATIGGIGLTGIIIEASLKLIKKNTLTVINKNEIVSDEQIFFSQIKDKSIKNDYCYGILNIGLLNNNNLIKTANFCNNNKIIKKKKKRNKLIHTFYINTIINIINFFPFNYLTLFLHIFCKLNLYQKNIHLNDYLYVYANFIKSMPVLQIQYVIDEKNSFKAYNEIKKLIKEYQSKPKLITIKYFKDSKNKFFSFPKEGFCLSFDFKNNSKNFLLIRKIIDIVIKYKGSIYLAKDNVINEKQFNQLFDKKEILSIIKKYNNNKIFYSDASIRYGLY